MMTDSECLRITCSIKHSIMNKKDKRNFAVNAMGNVLQHLANDIGII